MTFDWAEYLALAQELAGQAGGAAGPEARLRSSVSRAYYAAFCNARNFLRDVKHVSIPRENVHSFVISLFQRGADNNEKKVGADLDRLRRARNQADYDDSLPNVQQVMKSTLLQAQQAISTLGNL